MDITSTNKIKRGDIYFFDYGVREGSIQSGKRPVLVLQADNFNVKAPTIIVAAITTVIKKQYLPSHIILGEAFGLAKPSMVMIEQISAVNKLQLTNHIGFVDDEYIWKKINIALKKTFGLWFYNRERAGDIRCLCPKCLKDYMGDSNLVIRRLDPLAAAKEKCDKCENMGWDYVVYDKRTAFERGYGNER
ncbi:type II toxin-antitoxin system PemK/MazF family toxin [Caproicibacterium sp. BJN0003]|uniref:type II toxin-antitoxin system PemK/MazF family toxin n=1 Tax=Caproicibacterium sp. BJN0003 TaxID=2994078 RepID=UPI00224EA45B|nr:type II toxin-antitoxin system PemK/MazF family toxin [Caproicibacterium sp. BJN0003]UZT82395.1 type II toxin-antitoxin system PemK/MazF family toxin [Caproicibacterium sp. BJN0003]